MKNLVIVFLIALGIMSFKKDEVKNHSNNRLTESELKFIKENYNWDGENILVLNFRQPKRNCFYDNYENINNSINWWKRFYSKIDLTDVKNIFVYSDSISAKKILDFKTHFPDTNNFFLDNFFNNSKECYGVLTLNKIGEYEKVEGEYSESTVKKLISKLKT